MKGRTRLLLWLLPAFLMAAGITAAWGWDHVRHWCKPRYQPVDLKAMGAFLFDQQDGRTEDIPAQWRRLDGQRVTLTGFMYAPRSAGEAKVEFQFVYDVVPRRRGPPQVQERVYCLLPAARKAKLFSMYQIAQVWGVLHVGVRPDPDTGVPYS